MSRLSVLSRLLTLLLAAAMLSGMLALAEPAEQTDQPDGEVSYDIIYSASNPIPAIAARVRPSIVQLNTKAESWDPVTRVAEVKEIGGGSACYIRKIGEGEGGYMLTNYHVVKDGDVFTALWLDGAETDLEPSS